MDVKLGFIWILFACLIKVCILEIDGLFTLNGHLDTSPVNISDSDSG